MKEAFVAESDVKRLQLFKAVEIGANAEALKAFLFPILDKRKALLVDNLEKGNFYYQKIDNSELLTIQLELKLISLLREEAETLANAGAEASEAIRELNRPKPAAIKRPLRY